jgi:hypothetical protein
MSKFTDKARQIKAEGEATRGNYTPRGVPQKMYDYWLNVSTSDYAGDVKYRGRKENFCHYWRVVFIWAPLWFLGGKTMDFLDDIWGKVFVGMIVAGLLAFGIVNSVDFRMVLLVGLGALAFVGILIGTGVVIANLWPESWSNKFNAFMSDNWIKVFGTIGVSILAVIGLFGSWWTTAIIVAVIAFGAAVAYGISILVERAEAKADAEDKARREMISKMTNEEYWEYMANLNRKAPPGKIAKFFSGVGDFVVLIAQVVRVNKWKICPLVEVNDGRVSN